MRSYEVRLQPSWNRTSDVLQQVQGRGPTVELSASVVLPSLGSYTTRSWVSLSLSNLHIRIETILKDRHLRDARDLCFVSSCFLVVCVSLVCVEWIVVDAVDQSDNSNEMARGSSSTAPLLSQTSQKRTSC